MKNFTRSILLALCLPAMLVSCGNGGNAPKNPGEKADTLRLMTYNVGVFGKYVENSAPMIASMIKEMGANTCALNELDSCNTRTMSIRPSTWQSVLEKAGIMHSARLFLTGAEATAKAS